jgi:type IV pilus assembly protein PilW
MIMTTLKKHSRRTNIDFNIKSSAIVQAGFTLIELMVAMAISLLIAAGAVALFANIVFSTNTLNSATAISESGTRINEILARHLRMTGYVDYLSSSSLYDTLKDGNSKSFRLSANDTPSMFQLALQSDITPTVPQPLSGCDSGVYTNAKDMLNITCVTQPSHVSALSVAYQVVFKPEDNYAPSLLPQLSAKAGMSGNCNNESTAPELYAINRFYLTENNPSDWRAGEPIMYDLMCQGNPSTNAAQPLANNIEQWVVRYGVSLPLNSGTVSSDQRVMQYATATEISAAKAWNRVIAVRSCILVAGNRGTATAVNNGTAATTTTRTDCLGNPIRLGSELRLRQAFTQTVNLRNQIHTTGIDIPP